MSVADNMRVSVEYTLKDSEQNVIESNAGAEPLEYVHGRGQIIPGLEKALTGMAPGESKNVEVKPEEGYGVVNEEAFVEVPLDRVPEQARQVGMHLETKGEDGQVLHSTVAEIKDQTVVLNFNHPLAGQTLHFDVTVLSVQPLESAS